MPYKGTNKRKTESFKTYAHLKNDHNPQQYVQFHHNDSNDPPLPCNLQQSDLVDCTCNIFLKIDILIIQDKKENHNEYFAHIFYKYLNKTIKSTSKSIFNKETYLLVLHGYHHLHLVRPCPFGTHEQNVPYDCIYNIQILT